MKQRTLVVLYALHSWAGVITGLLMFVVCFSGAILVFKHEIDRWANAGVAVTRGDSVVSPDAALAAVRRAYPDATVTAIDLPDEVNPAYFVFLRTPDKTPLKVAVHPASGALLGPVDTQLGQFIRTLHVFLFFGPRWIVGFLGLAMLVSIVTGVLIHKKILNQLFTMRWDRSERLMWSDLHKVLGVWPLLFHIVIAFTGAWLGLKPVVVGAYDYVVHNGHPPPRVAESKDRTPAAMRPLADIVADAQRVIPGFVPTYVGLQRHGTAAAQVRVMGNVPDELVSSVVLDFNGATGALRERYDHNRGWLFRLDGMMEPLHFGDFGGLALKWLYFLLGLSPAIVSLTGTFVWIRRRETRRRETLQTHADKPAALPATRAVSDGV